jgi:hypothetical protein
MGNEFRKRWWGGKSPRWQRHSSATKATVTPWELVISAHGSIQTKQVGKRREESGKVQTVGGGTQTTHNGGGVVLRQVFGTAAKREGEKDATLSRILHSSITLEGGWSWGSGRPLRVYHHSSP